MSAQKWEVVEVARVNGMGELDDEGSYRRLVFDEVRPGVPVPPRVEVLISEGAAEVLVLDLEGLADDETVPE